MKIYTRTGDEGDTALFGGGRVPKSHPRVAAYGEVDELNSILGWALTQFCADSTGARIRTVQHDLFTLGADLATPPVCEGRGRPETPPLPAGRIAEMEAWIDETEASLHPLKEFILPGGVAPAAALHVARSVCRRAERAVVALAATESVDPVILTYLNRLSDLLFVFARYENTRVGKYDTPWKQP